MYFSTVCMVIMLAMTFVGHVAPSYAASKKSKSAAYVPKNASILIEASSGMVLEQNNANWEVYPASLTKLMTLLLVFDAIDNGQINLRSPITMSSRAANMPPSRLNVPVGSSITVDQAIRALVTKSANNIAAAVAEELAGSEASFARRMNLRAQEIGMNKTHFVNASGLHNSSQITTARDMAKLGQYIYKNKTKYYKYFSLHEFYYGGAVHKNHNHLMREYAGMDGMKTGYISQSGFNLVASAKQGNSRLIGVVIGGKTASSRNNQMRELLDMGFEKIKHVKLKNIANDNNKPILKIKKPNSQIKQSLQLTAPSITQNLNSSSNNWEIQLGAYKDRLSTDNALYNALQKLPAPLNRGNAIVMPLRTNDATWLFRARIGGYTKLQAEMACKHLKHCLIIAPQSN